MPWRDVKHTCGNANRTFHNRARQDQLRSSRPLKAVAAEERLDATHMTRVRNSLRAARQAARFSQEALGQAAGVSRQAYAAIESGGAVPSTEIALRLARALGSTVEQLFFLPDESRPTVIADLVGGEPPSAEPRRMRIVRVGGRLLARPLTGGSGILRLLPWADGLA